jgi:hypothetical protein
MSDIIYVTASGIDLNDRDSKGQESSPNLQTTEQHYQSEPRLPRSFIGTTIQREIILRTGEVN